MKNKIAKYLLLATLGMVIASYLPWVYLTVTYYILRYVIMACMAAAFVLTFSLETYCSERFVRLFFATILIVAVEFAVFKLLGQRFRPADLSQLVVACLCICIGMTLDWDMRQWADVAYYYTLGLIVMCVINCFFWAGNLIVPEHYMLDEGKNQIGGMVAIAGAVMYFFVLKMPQQRTHFLVLFLLTLLLLVLIRARSDCFALLACALFLSVKDIHWEWRPSLKNILTVLGILQVLNCPGHSAAMQVLVPDLGVFLLVCRRLLKNVGYLDISVLLGLGGEVGVLIPGLGFPGKSFEKVLLGF